MFNRFQRYNSQNKENVNKGYSPEEAFNSWIELTQDLIELKTKIHNANIKIAEKIFRLGELKNLVSRIRVVDTKSGLVKEHRHPDVAPIEYVAYMDLFAKDDQISKWEGEIEQLQEEIEAYNAITKI
jgi:hypothetical protein